MSAPLSSLVDNLLDGLHKCKDCKSSIEYINAKDSKVVFKCLNCYKNYKKDFNKELINNFQVHIIFVKEILINLICS